VVPGPILLHKKRVKQLRTIHICFAGCTLPVSSVLDTHFDEFVMSTATLAPGTVPSGQSAPFLIASPTDHSADIVLVAAMGIVLILITFAIRVYIRFNFSGPWLADDTVFALATVRKSKS
jgi:hypothetical protein